MEDLVVIEHDIEIHDQVISQFASCPSDWCTFAYWYPYPADPQMVYQALGCTKFSARLQRQFPIQAIEERAERQDGLPPRPVWHSCDIYITRALICGDVETCRHEPAVIHHRKDC